MTAATTITTKTEFDAELERRKRVGVDGRKNRKQRPAYNKTSANLPIQNRCRECGHKIDEFDSTQLGEDATFRVCNNCYTRRSVVSRAYQEGRM